jgi:hypothetical protein
MSKYVDSFFTVLKLDYNGGWELVDSIKGLISDEINDLTMSVDDIKKELEDSVSQAVSSEVSSTIDDAIYDLRSNLEYTMTQMVNDCVDSVVCQSDTLERAAESAVDEYLDNNLDFFVRRYLESERGKQWLKEVLKEGDANVQ